MGKIARCRVYRQLCDVTTFTNERSELASIRALLFSLLVSATFSFLAVKKVGQTKDTQGSLRLFPNSVLASFDAVALD